MRDVTMMADHSWTLHQLLDGVTAVSSPMGQQQITGLAVDSRKVKIGDLFFAISGNQLNGEHYIDDALEQGAAAVLIDRESSYAHNSASVVQVPALQQNLGTICSRFYGDPSKVLNITAVTGTDGKSSVAYLIASAKERLEGGAALLGTVENRLMGGEVLQQGATHTTPPPLELQQLLSKIEASGGRSVAMEASSHGIEQHRLAGTEINCAVLTQLGRDHLDYHGSMEAYAAAKRQLFTHPGLESVVLNLDDAFGRELVSTVSSNLEMIGYSLNQTDADLYGRIERQDHAGIQLTVTYRDETEVLKSPLYGAFNASNLLAALGALLSMDHSLKNSCRVLEQVSALQGRMEPFHPVVQNSPMVMVDYAHTAGALEAALNAVRQHLEVESGSLWVVFGCGGERDRGKRAPMGAVAEQWADHVVITSDNPRGEAPATIIAEILQGVTQPQQVTVIEDRRQAIEQAFQSAGSGDVVLIAGKGHEQWQQIGREKIPFSDRAVAEALVKGEANV